MSHEARSDDEQKRAEFEAIALPWLDAVYRVALRLTRQPADAADLAQETLLRAYRTFGNFQPGTNSRAWLFTIMYSIFINEQRRLARRGVHVPIDLLEQDDALTAPSDAGPSQTLMNDVVRGFGVGPEVARALGSLTPEFRAAVLLVDAEAMTYEEAAAVLQCPVGTVRSRLYRARRHLAAALREYATRSGFTGGSR